MLAHAAAERWAHRRLAVVPVDVHEAATRGERAHDATQERRAIVEVMGRVHDEREIARVRRQQRLAAERQDGRDVVDTRACDPPARVAT